MNTTTAQSEKRVGVACEECRKRKRKCDGFRPSCTSCVTSQKSCQYAGTVETRKRKKWDAEYLSVLEDQIATLRKQIADLQQPTPSSTFPLPNDGHETVSKPTIASIVSLDEQANHQHAEADIADLKSDLHLEEPRLPGSDLCVSAIEDLGSLVWRLNIGDVGEPAFIGPSGNFCIPSSVGAVISHSKVHDAPHGISRRDFSSSLPIKRRLSTLFMEQLNPIHQFVPPSVALMPDLYPFGDLGLDILYGSIFAAGALFSDDEEEREAGTAFADYVDNVAVATCRQQPSVMVVQALSILAWRELSQEHNNLAWVYASMAGGLSVGLGLHVIGLEQLSDPSKAILDHERETRLRTFWSFFLLDRIATSTLGRSSIIPWRRVEVPNLDCILTDAASIEEVAFSHQCKLWQLHDKYMDQIYAFDFDALEFSHRNRLLLSARTAVLEFKQKMSSQPQLEISSSNSNKLVPPAVIFLQMSYQMSLLIIHRPYLREQPDSSSFNLALVTMSSAATRMTYYIQLFHKLHIQHKSASDATLAPSFIIHHILTASIMHLLSGTVPNHSQRGLARRKLQPCLEVLSLLQGKWSAASKAIAQIQELAVQWKIVGVLPLKWSFVVGDVPIITHDSPDRRSDNTKAPPSANHENEIDQETAKQMQPFPGTDRDFVTEHGTGKKFKPLTGEVSAFGTLERVDYVAHSSSSSSGLEYSLELGSMHPQNTSDMIDNTNIDTYILTSNDMDLPPLDSQFYPDYSALQDVFDMPESWSAF